MKRTHFQLFSLKTIFLIMSLLGTIMLSRSQPIVAQTESDQAEPGSEADRENVTIHNYYTSPPFEEIYYYAIETESGLILIDTGRLLSQA